MQVILLERVEKLGQMGDVVTVKNGYARNFLLPRSKAMRATTENIAAFENQRKDLEARNLERRNDADAVAEKMAGTSVVLIRQAGETGQLYGSVNARDVVDALAEAGFQIERSQVVLDRPIKTLGLHDLRIALHPEVSQTVQVNVARSEDEAKLQAQGISVLAAEEDEIEEEEEAVDMSEAFEEDSESPALEAADDAEPEESEEKA